MTTTGNQTKIEIDQKVPLVRIIREFDAPVSKVFQAHADATLIVQWLGPRSLSTRAERYDCVTGGAYRYIQTRDDDEFAFHGSFHEVRTDELIVQTFTYEGMPDSVALERMVFEDVGDGRTRLTAESLVDSFEARDQFVASGMEEGIREGYERLDELLAG